MGTANLEKVLMLLCEGLNCFSKVANKGGILSLLSMIDEVNAISGVSSQALIAEAKDLSDEEAKALVAKCKEKLSLVKPDVEMKVEEALDLLLQAARLVNEELRLVNEGKVLLDKVKALVA